MKIQLLAHRGGMNRAPENTLASFKQALTDGADGYECDVCPHPRQTTRVDTRWL